MATSSELDQLRDLLLAPEVTTLHALTRDLELLQRQIGDPDKLAVLLKPVLADMVHRADPALSLAMLKALTPLLDRAVRDNITADPRALTSALAPTSTGAIALHYAQAPEAASTDLAPLVSAAIKEQVRGERDAMIDALYPVIGSTISKYLAETLSTLVRQINEKIESHLSVHSVIRTIRSRLTGVSEAELLLRESLPMAVDAAFLIHTESGLIIAQSQNPDGPSLDSDLLSGMLTAIRSLFNDSMEAGGPARELDQISYGESTILLEVAGFCYLAVVVRGIPDDVLRRRMRDTLAEIVQVPGDTLETFSGDPSTLPPVIHPLVQQIVSQPPKGGGHGQRRRPYAVMIIAAIVFLAVLIPFGISWYRDVTDREQAERIRAALATTHPALSHGIDVAVDRETVRLSGTTANQYQRDAAGVIVHRMMPEAQIENTLSPAPVPPFSALVEVQAEAMAGALNRMTGVFVAARYRNGNLRLEGIAPDSHSVHGIAQAFGGLPGLQTLRNDVNPADSEVGRRVQFERGSALLPSGTLGQLAEVADILRQTPWSRLLVVGHTDRTGEERINKRLSLERTLAVHRALISAGVPAERILTQAEAGPPGHSAHLLPDSLSRCVVFKLIPSTNGSLP